MRVCTSFLVAREPHPTSWAGPSSEWEWGFKSIYASDPSVRMYLKYRRKVLLGWEDCHKSVDNQRVKQGGELNLKPRKRGRKTKSSIFFEILKWPDDQVSLSRGFLILGHTLPPYNLQFVWSDYLNTKKHWHSILIYTAGWKDSMSTTSPFTVLTNSVLPSRVKIGFWNPVSASVSPICCSNDWW